MKRRASSSKTGLAVLSVFLVLFAVTGIRDAVAGETLTLDECIERAIAGNHELEALRKRVEAASARVDEVSAGLKPRLSVVAKYLWVGEQQRLWPARYDGERGVYGDEFAEATAVMEIRLYDGGRTRHLTEAEKKLREASLASLAHLEKRLRYDISRLFYMILAQKEAISALEAALESLVSHERDVLAMLEAGKAARADSLRMAAEVASAREKLLQADHDLQSLKEDLRMVMGMEESAPPFDLEGGFPGSPVVPDKARLIEEAMEFRSDYKAALQKVESGEYGELAARAAKSPDISLRGVHAYRGTSGAGESRTDVELYFEIPVYDGGISDAKARRAAAEAAAAESEARALAERIGYEVSESLRALETARKRAELSGATLEAAEEGLRIEKLKFRSGRGTTTDVLVAHAAWLSAVAEEAAARAGEALSAARLDFVSGGAGHGK